MRRLCYILPLSFIVFLSLTSISFSADYVIEQLTDNDTNILVANPQLNENGYVVWSQSETPYDEESDEETLCAVFQYDGSTIKAISPYDAPIDYNPENNSPQINDNN